MIDVNDLIGKPYIDGGRGIDGYDCYGLAIEVYNRFGIELPDYSISAEACEEVSKKIQSLKSSDNWIKLDAPKVPCIVLLRAHPCFINHFGVYIGESKFIHIRDFGVCVEKMSTSLWKKRIEGFYDYEQ